MTWTLPTDIVQRLRDRWLKGGDLAAQATGRDWKPMALTIKGPSVSELGNDLAAVQAWAARWSAQGGLRVESRPLGGRKVGTNAVPAKAWVDTPGQLWRLLGVVREVERFGELFERTSELEPALLGWMADHPLKVLSSADSWLRLVATVTWVAGLERTSDVYLRQVGVPGVDTKFIEANRSVLTDLLDLRLPTGRIDTSVPRSDFAGRYGFLRKPGYVRVRHLDGERWGFTEMALRTAELAANPLPVTTVYVVENEVTYLAFPAVRDAVVLWGSGYAVSVLRSLSWLRERELVYWGDIDTHGFRILHRLREYFPAARSMLMDRATLLSHESQWVDEPAQVREPLTRLTEAETALYHDLVEDLFGPAVRLEQERVGFAALKAALGPD